MNVKCKFCGNPLETKRFREIDYFVCNRHKPSKVGYKPVVPGSRIISDLWHVTHGNYRLTYRDGETFFRKMNFDENVSTKDFYTLIKRFNHELKIKPEDFGKKLPTLLTFL